MPNYEKLDIYLYEINLYSVKQQQMRSDRVSYDFANWGNSANNSRFNAVQTPRNKNKQMQINESNRRSISPIRYNMNNNQNDRVTSSPLRVPLQQAISRCVRQKSSDKSASRRTLGKSSRRQEQTSFIEAVKKISYEDQLNNRNIKAHSQTLKFIKKYFDINSFISTEEFISKILQQYGNMWDNQNLEQVLEDFNYKVNQMFGIDGIDPRILIMKTKNDGMLGLIMNIFKEIKQEQSTRNSNYTSFSRNPQVMSINKSFEERLNYNQNVENIKNVVQQFMQSMYQCMETQIYNKFNIQMRRMVLKYREAQKIIKKVNQKITTHVDFFDLEEKLRKQKKFYEEKLNQNQRNYHKLDIQLEKQRELNNELKNSKFKVEQENRKLKQSMDKLQGALISKALQGGSSTSNTSQMNDPALSRRSTMPFIDRTQQYSNLSNNQLNLSTLPSSTEPFQIKIDTHIIQKDLGSGMPSTYTTTTFGQNNLAPLSPLKREENKENNNFMDGRYSYSPYGSRLGNTGMY